MTANVQITGAYRTRAARAFLAVVGVSALALLAGCTLIDGGPRSDREAVQAALQETVEAVPGYVDGSISFQDGFSPGTSIRGTMWVDATDRAGAEAIFEDILEAVVRTYVEQENAREAGVYMRAYPESDEDILIEVQEVVPPRDGSGSPDTTDLVEHFDL